MRARRRWPNLGWALALVTGATLAATGPSMVLGQSPEAPAGASASPSQSSSPFVVPTPPALAAAPASAVDDAPAVLPDTVDLTSTIETAYAHLDSLPSTAWEVAGLGGTLADPTAAFELVRDSIRFDAYPGVLRGAEGTLTARAGNAFDRALLLKALLDVQGATSRYAFGQLDTDHAAALAGRALEAPVKPLQVPDFSPLDPGFEQAVGARARRDYALLSAAFGDRLAGLNADGTAAAVTDVTSHAWVQVQRPDGTWLDLDPSMPDARPGQALTTADATADAMPDTARQTVTLRVITEMLQDGAFSESDALEATLDPTIAADQQLLVTFAPDTGGGGGLLGGGPGGVLGGGGGQGRAYLPILTIDGGAWGGSPISLTVSGGGGGLMGGGSSPQDLASLSLEVETDAPGTEPQIVRHIILDRVPAAARAGGSVTADDLLPVADAGDTPAVFSTVLHVMLSTGGLSARAYARQQALSAQTTAVDANAPNRPDEGLAVAYAPLAVADETLVAASEQRIIPALDDGQVRTFITRPRVYLSSWANDAADPTQVVAQTDLLIDGVRTMPRASASVDAAARQQLWYGALQGAMETEFGRRGAAAFDPSGVTMTGVSFQMDQPLVVLSASDTTSLPTTSSPGLTSALASGAIVIVPGDAATARAWWQVDQDGTTRSILAPGLGGVGRVGPPASSGGTRVEPIKQLPRQPGEQRRPEPKSPDEWEEGDDETGDEYGTLVNQVATKTEEVAQPGSEELRLVIEKARLGMIRG